METHLVSRKNFKQKRQHIGTDERDERTKKQTMAR